MRDEELKLADIQAILGVSKAAASMVRAGKYAREGSDLPRRYEALLELIKRVRRESLSDTGAICYACPREDCSGCRLAEL